MIDICLTRAGTVCPYNKLGELDNSRQAKGLKHTMKKLLLVLALLCPTPLAAQTALDHIATAQAELDAAKALLPAPGPVYTALSDHTIKPKPTPLALGPAGFAFTDPTFGSRMWRVTDASTSAGSSIRVPSSAHAAAWNSDGTKFFAMNEGGGTFLFGFDGAKVISLGVVTTSQIEPSFSYVDPNLIFGVVIHKVKSWRIDTGAVSDVFDLEAAYPQLPLADTYVGGFMNVDNDKWVIHFGGTGQDRHVFVHHSTAGLLDLRTKTWKIHATSMDRTGRYVFIYPANDPNTGRLPAGVAQVQLWDTQTGTLTPLTNLPAGHDSQGYGVWVNADCCSAGTWDASQWQIRNLTTPNSPSNLIPSVLTPQEVYLGEHSNWRAARADVKVPFVSASYRYGAGVSQVDYPWRAWDEEIIAVATDGSGKVWRFAHHQSIVGVQPDFWSEPIVSVSPNGRYALFTSNWGTAGGREDVFVVALY